jgi:hypothetical protein
MHPLAPGAGARCCANKGTGPRADERGQRGARVDEKKKPEASWDEPERVGPYKLEEEVSPSRDCQSGLYRATNETSGAPALVLKYAPEADEEPREDCGARFTSSASEGYMAMEPEQTPFAVDPDRHSAESLVSTLEEVSRGVRRMAQALPTLDKPRPGCRLGLKLAGAAGVVGLLVVLVCLALVSQRPGDPEPVASAASEPGSHDLPAVTEALEPHISSWLGNNTPEEEPVFARPLPRQPFKGQKRPPCTRLVEVELIGACWGPHKLKAPCPDQLFEHQGECYAPIINASPPPQSVEP